MIGDIVIPLIGLSIIITSAYIDYEHLKDNDWIEDHKSRVVIRAIFGLLLAIINIKYAISYAFLFMGLFSPLLNMLRDKSFWYLGNTAKTDIFFKQRPLLYKVVAILSIILGVLLNFINMDNQDILDWI